VNVLKLKHSSERWGDCSTSLQGGTILDYQTEYFDGEEEYSHAVCKLYLWHSDKKPIVLERAEFLCETEKEAEKQGEKWAQAHFDKIVNILAEHYKIET
jgi:hypothetical protein